MNDKGKSNSTTFLWLPCVKYFLLLLINQIEYTIQCNCKHKMLNWNPCKYDIYANKDFKAESWVENTTKTKINHFIFYDNDTKEWI